MIALHNLHFTCRVIARLCGEDALLANKIRKLFPLVVEPDLSTRLLHPLPMEGEEKDGVGRVEEWRYPLVTPEVTPGSSRRTRRGGGSSSRSRR